MTFKTSTLEKIRSKNEKKSSSKVDYFIVLWLVRFFLSFEIRFFSAWQFNGNVNMKSQRSVPKIIAETRFGWYFCSMSVHHCRPIRWWTGGGMTCSCMEQKKIETNCLIEMLMLSLKILQVSLLIIIVEKFVFHSDDDWHIEWIRQFREKKKRDRTHTHTYTHTEFILLTTR